MDIVDGKIGSVGNYELDFVGGSLVVKVGVGIPQVGAALEVKVNAAAVLDVIAKAIPGTFDDRVIELAKAALASQG